MKTFWLKKQNSSKLILFFCGWGMDENTIKHLKTGAFDVLAVYDYSDLEFEQTFETYAEITVIAWSMGVLAASIVCRKLNIKKAIAINGTQNPIDADFGIPPKIYSLTLNNFSENTRNRFFENMFTSKEEYKNFAPPKRALENQQQELEILQTTALQNNSFNFEFDSAFISKYDKIISAKNQKNFWQTKKVKVVELNCGHYPFFEIDSLEEIINETL